MEKLKNVFCLMNLSMCFFEENWDDGSIVHHCCCGKVIMKKTTNDSRSIAGYIIKDKEDDDTMWEILLANNKRTYIKKLHFNRNEYQYNITKECNDNNYYIYEYNPIMVCISLCFNTSKIIMNRIAI